MESVLETTRPLPIEPIAETPDFVLGLCVIRGAAVPVVDAGRLLSGMPALPARFVLLRVGTRRVALAVEAVLGLSAWAAGESEELAPLVCSANSDAIAAIGALDAELLLVLRAVGILPEDLLARMEAEALAS